jgi:hypothetical protein
MQPSYESYFIRLLSFLDDRKYSRGEIFNKDGTRKISNERMLLITPEQIVRFMYMMAFKTADPPPKTRLFQRMDAAHQLLSM